ncbi:TetR/AcrR family transcriptional regulator [Nocardia sp. NPDC088792]|uniref:TetR/AcrR family transcriptional regulator n=1 Tax=Nocardia sp. NPDC088792 TaxID=3364332 RepID=UPI00382AD431
MAKLTNDEDGSRSYRGLTREERLTDRLDRMLEAGLQLFGTRGYGAVSISDVCQVAQVSRSAFYNQIGTLESLLMKVVSAIDERAFEHAGAVLAASPDESFGVRAERALRAYMSVTCADTRTARVCYVEIVGVSDAVEEWRGHRRELFVSVLAGEACRGIARGELPDRDYRYTALAAVGAVNSLAHEWLVTHDSDAAVELDRIAAELSHVVVASVIQPIGDRSLLSRRET